MTNLLYKDILLIIDKDTVLFLCLFRNPKKKNYPQSYDLWKATRLKKPPGLWEKPPHLQQYIWERMSATNELLGQFSVYIGKNFWIFVLKLRRFA